MPKRNRIIYLAGVFAFIALGLLSRSDMFQKPVFIKEYASDTLWALVVYLIIAFFVPRLPIKVVILAAAIFSFTVEVSQLYHAPWIDGLRHIRLVGLVIGFGFLWSDLICYGVGVIIGASLDLLYIYRQPFFRHFTNFLSDPHN